ncbi:MAG TPA: hypothetical protein DD716_02320 [Thiomicrospira sp.]|jgi:membrane protein YdbS with pleckstrin-like domain|nr:hypothetical protein [Thiomicrospira sp.]
MSKESRIKEELAWLKMVFAIIVAISISILAWMAQNYQTTHVVILMASLFVVALFAWLFVKVVKIVYKKLDELEEI